MKWEKLAIAILSMLIIAGCSKKDDLTKDDLKSNKNKIELEGQWLRHTDGLEITISGETGTFTNIVNGGWLTMQNLGLVDIGDLKFKSLKSTGELQWKGEELWNHISNQEIKWANDGVFQLNNSGDTLTVSSTNPFNGTTPSIYTMTRKQ
ncbi:MAG: hypothetical protein K9J13_10675 [Saprospiraceae bacterium]|nr:hypothetical protein [Saprospiraceae bacterium]